VQTFEIDSGTEGFANIAAASNIFYFSGLGKKCISNASRFSKPCFSSINKPRSFLSATKLVISSSLHSARTVTSYNFGGHFSRLRAINLQVTCAGEVVWRTWRGTLQCATCEWDSRQSLAAALMQRRAT
jgi:hypothetical protein